MKLYRIKQDINNNYYIQKRTLFIWTWHEKYTSSSLSHTLSYIRAFIKEQNICGIDSKLLLTSE